MPDSIKKGATINYNGFALRWIKQYESAFFADASVLNTYWGTAAVTDRFVHWDSVSDPQQEQVGQYDHFVRAIKLRIGGESTFHPTGAAGTALTAITGVGQSTLWDGDGSNSA